MSIRQGLNKVLREYSTARAQPFKEHPLAGFIRNELPDAIREAVDEPERFIFKGSAGQGNWSRGPWVGVFNPIITTSAQVGFYPVYLFREDMSGVYLSLNQAMTEQKTQYKADARTVLRARAQNYRAIVGPQTGRISKAQIDLTPSSKLNDTAFYEAGNILAIFYPRESIPSDFILQEDLMTTLGLYDALIRGETALEAETQVDGDEPQNLSYEDATKLRIHKRIERNKKLANAAKNLHGSVCQVCGFDFEVKYGEIGKGYIEAHHLEPLSCLEGKVSRDPRKDFAVLCSNCHRMIHKTAFVGDIAKFKALIRK